MSGKWCHLCQLVSAKEFNNLMVDGEPWWTNQLMQEHAAAYATNVGKNPREKPTKGVNEAPWWPFIPINHFVVPLLHCLIGIRNDILAKFRAIVSEKIEYISPEELDVRKAGEAIVTEIEELVRMRDSTFDAINNVKRRKTLKARISRVEKSLKDMGAVVASGGLSWECL